ncbi:MAG: ribulose-phosphate 3-epimerase [Acidimicrobiia bacterium]|nr:ribulose-phosphate 3-epimerase [Acidimicrobiia bacterium]
MSSVVIAPSILAADFSRLGEEVNRVEESVDMLHIDVMDGHFVPNISLGIPVIQSLRPVTALKFDCHLMMTNPDFYFEPLKAAGADLATVHLEAYPNPQPVAKQARDAGLEFGLAINPPTPYESIDPYVELCDLILIMSVHPGFGGQSFIEEVLSKVELTRKKVDSLGLMTDIEVDGGIGPENIRRAKDAGANVFVAGSSIFRADDPVAAVTAMRTAVEA